MLFSLHREGRINLVAPTADPLQEATLRPDTNISTEDADKSSNQRSSTSNLQMAEDGSLTGRSSRASRTSRLTNGMSILSLQNSNAGSQASPLSVNAAGAEAATTHTAAEYQA